MTGVLAMMAGSGSDTAVTLIDALISSSGLLAQTSGFELNSDRSTKVISGDLVSPSITNPYDWLASYASPSNYEVRATLASGALTTGTTGSWMGLGTTRSWSVNDAAADATPEDAELLIEIRNATTTIVADSATIILSANRT